MDPTPAAWAAPPPAKEAEAVPRGNSGKVGRAGIGAAKSAAAQEKRSRRRGITPDYRPSGPEGAITPREFSERTFGFGRRHSGAIPNRDASAGPRRRAKGDARRR